MARQLSGSVGIGGKNVAPDVTSVQELLNLAPGGLGGPPFPVVVDGVIGPETVAAINRFQSKNFGWADGRVDPSGKTLAKLNAYAGMEGDPGPAPSPLSAAKPKLPGAGPAKPSGAAFSSSPAAPQVDGNGTTITGALITSVSGTVTMKFPGSWWLRAFSGFYLPPGSFVWCGTIYNNDGPWQFLRKEFEGVGGNGTAALCLLGTGKTVTIPPGMQFQVK